MRAMPLGTGEDVHRQEGSPSGSCQSMLEAVLSGFSEGGNGGPLMQSGALCSTGVSQSLCPWPRLWEHFRGIAKHSKSPLKVCTGCAASRFSNRDS